VIGWPSYLKRLSGGKRLRKENSHDPKPALLRRRPAAQLKLKELEGKTTFEEINPKDDNSNITTELLVLCNRQASDIRRLTKAGDAMAEEIALAKRQDEGSRFDPIEMHYDHELIVKWNAAKEGKSGA